MSLNIQDGMHNGVRPLEDLKKGDLLLWYADVYNWGVYTFEYYSQSGGIYSCEEGSIIDTDVVGIVYTKTLKKI